MSLKVTNTTDEVVEVTTGGAPWYSFHITTPKCQLIWHWPTAILLPITYHRLLPGETIGGRTSWYGLNEENKPVRAGTYVASAFMSLSLGDDPDDLVVGAKQFTVTKPFLASVPEPTATPIPPPPVPFQDRNIKFGECRQDTWVKPFTDEDIWALINADKSQLVPDSQGIAVPGTIERFYRSNYTPHRGIIVYLRESWVSDNWDSTLEIPSCHSGVPIEVRAFKGASTHPVSDHIDPKTGRMPVTDHDACRPNVPGPRSPSPSAASGLSGIKLSSERIAWYVPIEVRITMRNTTDQTLEFNVTKDSPNVLVYRPDTCEFVRTFNMQQDSGVPQTLAPYEIVEWIVEWPRPDPRQWDWDNEFLLYPTFTFFTEGKPWQWVGSGMQVPRPYP